MANPATTTGAVTPEVLSQAFGGMGQFGGKKCNEVSHHCVIGGV